MKTGFVRVFVVLAYVSLSWFSYAPPVPVFAATPVFTSTDDVYYESFDGLLASGVDKPWINNSTIVGWYANRSVYRTDNGDDTTGSIYSYGQNSVKERALGSHPTAGVGTLRYGVVLTNNTNQNISYVAVSYYGEQWLDSDSVPQTLALSYVIGSNLDQTTLDTAVGTNEAALDFVSYANNNTDTKVDGNTTRINIKSVIALSTSLNIGQQIMLRWTDVDDPPADHGMAIDDVAVKLSLDPTSAIWGGSSLSVDQASAAAGDELTYTLKIIDDEGGPYSVSAVFPDSVSIVAAPGMTISDNSVNASGTLVGGISQTYRITVRVNAGSSGIISATALITDGVYGREFIAPDVVVLRSLYLPLVVR